jgi:hypothetical protein
MDKGGFFTRSTSAPASETVLTEEIIRQAILSIEEHFADPPAPVPYICSPKEYKEIMTGKSDYAKVVRRLLNIEEPK